MTVYLVPVGRDRYDLYSEAVDEPGGTPGRHEGFLRRLIHAASTSWHDAVHTARRGTAVGRLARWRDGIICRLAESIAEQRTLWALRDCTSATVHVPATFDSAAAKSALKGLIAGRRRHHRRWLVVDLGLFVLSGVFFFVPGPNLVAYYFAIRLIGHLQSWRGARQATERIAWTLEPEQGLAELASLVDVPRAARAPRVAAIAAQLNLPHLSAFFDHVALPSP
jgi:hypothetical protein